MGWFTTLRTTAPAAPARDETAVGVSFIDVLFALVIGGIFNQWSSNPVRPGFGVSHLALAFVVTITSWVGYHNSRSRPQYQIRFVNLPLFQFVLDVALVITYWLLVNSAELTDDRGRHPRPDLSWDTACVAVAAVLYVMWDWAALRLRKDDKYDRTTMADDVPARRYVSVILAVATVVFTVIVNAIGPVRHSATAAITVDAVLIVFVLAYRVAKDRYPPPVTTRTP